MTTEVQAFAVKADRAIANLRQKVPVATEKWNDWLGPIHGRQFTVAGAPADVVADIKAALVKGLENGTTLTQFRKDFDQIVARTGWSYNGTRGWRTQLIYETNMHSAYMAGKWQQIVDNADKRPYLEYRSMRDNKVRPLHRQWDGTLLPISSQWWGTHYPPCGYRCRCTVRSYSEREMKAAGKVVSDPPKVQRRPILNEYDEIADWVPAGIDQGWDHNVGQSWLAPELALGKRLASLPVDLQSVGVSNSIGPEFRSILADRWKQAVAAPDSPLMPAPVQKIVGFMDEPLIKTVNDQFPGSPLQSLTLVADEASDLAAWPAAWVNQLPDLARNYKAVVMEAGATAVEGQPTMLLIPDRRAGNKQAVIRVRFNQAIDTLYRGAVVKLETIDPALLNSAAYSVVSGEL